MTKLERLFIDDAATNLTTSLLFEVAFALSGGVASKVKGFKQTKQRVQEVKRMEDFVNENPEEFLKIWNSVAYEGKNPEMAEFVKTLSRR